MPPYIMAFWSKKNTAKKTSMVQKTHDSFRRLLDIFSTQSTLSDAHWDALRRALLATDVGMAITAEIMKSIQHTAKKQAIRDYADLYPLLHRLLRDRLPQKNWDTPPKHTPQIILMVGVNGGGKTTSCAKLTHHFKQQQCSTLLAAGDTFRAAAIEQLDHWATQLDVPIIKQQHGADSAALLFDAHRAATARQIQYVIADTAGRMTTQQPLMAELRKIKEVASRCMQEGQPEVWLTIDACLGQHSLVQAQSFHEEVGLTGCIITKLDHSAKGGMLFAISETCNLPIYFIGTGEKHQDWQAFDADAFVTDFLPQSL